MSLKCLNDGKLAIYEHVFDIASAPGFIARDRSVILDTKNFIISQILPNYTISESGKVTKKDLENLAEYIINVLEDLLIDVGDPKVLKNAIVDLWLNSDELRVKQQESTSSERLVNLTDEEMYKLLFNLDYFRDAFGGSNKTLLDAKRLARKMLTRAFVYSSHGIVATSRDLRESIMREQQQLVDIVLDYLKYKYSSDSRITPEGQTVLNRFTDMFDESGNFIDIISPIERTFGRAFDKPENLFEIQVRADGAKGFNSDYDSKRFIEAYRSWVLLKNFSRIVEDTFGNAVSINKDLNEYDPNRYSIGESGSNVYTTWRTSDEIFLNEELNNIVQLIVTSVPMYAYGINQPLEDSELRLNDFNYIIGKIKNFAESINASDTKLFNSILSIPNLNLSQETLRIVKNSTSLAEIINKIRLNPSKYIPAVFELLSNPSVYNTLIKENLSSDIRLGGFNANDKNLIYTLYKNFFDRTNDESLIRNQERTGFTEKNYYGYLTQVIDSVFTNKYLLYYRDENGRMRIRGMMGQQLDNLRSRIERSIQSKHAREAIVYSDYSNKYNIVPTITNQDLNIESRTFEKLEFSVPLYTLNNSGEKIEKGLRLHITVDGKKETVSYEILNRNGEVVDYEAINPNNDDKSDYSYLFDNVAHFIEDMTGFDVGSDKFKKSYLTAILGTQFTKDVFDLLLNFSSRILSRIYLSSNWMVDSKGEYLRSKEEARSRVKQIFKITESPNNYIYPATGELKLVSNLDLETVRSLASAYAYIRDLATSSVIKDGSGNSLSADSLSKLGASYRTLWDTLNKKEGSATKHYMLFDPNLFMGLFQAKELKDSQKDKTKSHVDFNPTEMLDAALIYDYFDGLTSNANDKEHNKVFFLASVNSDKSNIGRIKINLNYNILNLYKDVLSKYQNYLQKLNASGQLSGFPTLEYNQDSVNIFNRKCKLLNVTARDVILNAHRNANLGQLPDARYFGFNADGDLIINPDITENKTLAEIIKEPNGESKFRNIIRLQLGEFYSNVINNIKRDLEKVNEILPEETPKLDYTPGSYEAFNLWCKNKGLNPTKYLNETIAEYNYDNPNNIITLTDLIHIISKNGEIKVNLTLLGLNETLNSEELTNEYFDRANEQIFKLLLKDDFLVNVEPTSESTKIKTLYTTSELRTWVNSENEKLVLGIITYTLPNGQTKTKRVTQNTDLISICKDLGIPENSTYQQIKSKIEELYYNNIVNQLLANEDLSGYSLSEVRLIAEEAIKFKLREHAVNLGLPENSSFDDILSAALKNLTPDEVEDIKALEAPFKVTLNPQIAKYNALNYLFTQEWLSSTVGTHMAHPSKAKFKNGYNLVEDEASRFNAQHKRNVSFTASMHEFQLNLLNGIPSVYNVSVIREVTDELYNIMGLTDDSVSPYDGATFVNPFIVYLENYSLGGAKAGMNKKLFVHYYDEHTGNGGIIKTAGFGLNNLLISDSPQMRTMMYNMTGRKWRLENGELFEGNIFETYNGNQIYTKSDDETIEGGYDLGDIYYKDKSGNVIKITNIEYVAPNLYKLHRFQVNDENNIIGNEINPNEIFTIDSNWRLWEAFGGERSVEYDERAREFVQSENSIKLVVNMMNRVGIRKNNNVTTQEDVYQFMKHSDIHYMPVEGSVKQGAANMNSSDMWNTPDPERLNFMKVNMNQAGIQLDKEHHADAEEVSLMTQVISACAQRGYTLDKSTQMYSALASLARVGVLDLYKALEELYQIKQEGSEESYDEYNARFQETVVKLVFDSLIHQSETADLVSKIAQKFVQEAKLGRQIQFRSTPDSKGLDEALPYSIDEIYRKTHSIINVALTRAAIKIKLPGVLSILCPSFNIMKLYNGKLYHEYLDPEAELAAIQENTAPVWRHTMGNVEIVNYRVGNVQPGALASSNSREGVKLSKENISVDEYMDYIFGRGVYGNSATAQQKAEVFRQILDDEQIEGDLETFLRQLIKTPEDVKFVLVQHELSHLRNHDNLTYFEGDDPEAVRLRDRTRINWMSNRKVAIEKRATMDALHRLIEYKLNNTDDLNLSKISLGRTYIIQREDGTVERKLINTPNDYYQLKRQLQTPYVNIDKYNSTQPSPIVSITEDVVSGRNLGHYNVIFKGNGKVYNIYDLDSVKRCYKLEASIAPKDQITEARRSLQRDLFKLHKGEGSVLIGGNITTIDEIIEEIPYEIIMPKTAKTDFGLSTGDNLSDIVSDPDFFVKKILNNYSSRLSLNSDLYDLELKRLNGDHVYIIGKDRMDELKDDPNYLMFLEKRKILKLVINGEVWRMDPDTKEKMYKLSPRENIEDDSKDDEVYIFDDGTERVEIIVSDNFEHYLGTQNYIHAAIPTNLKVNYPGQYERVRQAIESCAVEGNPNYNKALEELFEDAENETFDTLNALINSISSITDLNNLAFKTIVNKIRRNGALTHASFMKSLEIIAARIPAQSMQSFMPMKIVGFDNSDRNTAYVSTAQIWLQGSDYDIDAVTLTNFSFDKNGKYITWSPLSNISSHELLKASDELPFPTGESLLIINARNRNKPNKPTLRISASQLVDRRNRARKNAESIRKWAELIEYINKYGTENIEFDEGTLQTTIDEIYKIVDNHNNYINVMYRKGGHWLEGAVKNYMLTQMYNISIDPVNLPASQLPVDTTTKPLKSKANERQDVVEEQQESTPASFIDAIHSIYENLVGKTGVGICAVGLKSYFATTQAMNMILDEGTASEKRRCVLGKSGRGVTIKGHTYRTFSNIYKQNSDPYDQISIEENAFRSRFAQDVDTLYERRLIEEGGPIFDDLETRLTGNELEKAKREVEAGIREECFSITKQYYENEYPEYSEILNTILDYNDIISPEIRMLNAVNNDVDSAVNLSALLSLATDNAKELALAKLNAGTGTLGMYIYGLAIGVSFDNIFSILTSPVALEISKLIRGNSFTGDPTMMIDLAFSYLESGPSSEILNFIYKYRDINGEICVENLVGILNKRLGQSYPATSRGLASLLTKISDTSILEEARSGFSSAKVTANKLIDLCEKYVQIHNIKEADKLNYDDLKILSKGAEEFRILGQILHINQGLYTSIPDSINYLNTFKNLIPNEQIDILKFCMDENYREEMIDKYELKLKHTLNILQIVSKVPHFLEYLQIAALSDAMMENLSAKYRATKRFSELMIEEYEIRTTEGKKNLIKRMDTMVNTVMINDWLLSTGKKITIKKGNTYYVEGEPLKMLKAASDMTIALGTDSGNATFKHWMETVVIPDLKRGMVHHNGASIRPSVRDNQFIQDLLLNIYQNTPNYNIVYGYTLPINMSPRSDEEVALFDTYKAEFMKLNNNNFGYYYMPKHPDGKDNFIRIVDLFFLYLAILTQDKPGESNLHSLFNDMQDSEIVKDFYNYVNVFDRTEDISTNRFPKEYIKRFVIPKVNPSLSTADEIIYSDPDFYGTSVWTLVDPSSEETQIGQDERFYASKNPARVYIEKSKRNISKDLVTPYNTSRGETFITLTGETVEFNYRLGRLHNSNYGNGKVIEVYTDKEGVLKTKQPKYAVLVTEGDTQYIIKTRGEGSTAPYEIAEIMVKKPGSNVFESVPYKIRDKGLFKTITSRQYFRMRKNEGIVIPIKKRTGEVDKEALWMLINSLIHKC